MRYFKCTLFLGILLFSCNKLDCNKEKKRISNLHYNFTITKKYIKDHQGWIEGIDSLGNMQKFGYTGFFDLDKLAKPNAIFLKDSGSLIFRIKTDSLEHILEYDCLTAGRYIKTDSIR